MVYPNITLSLLLVNLLAVTGKITFSSKVEFSEPIEVEFEYENATIHDYIGIYDNKNGDGLDVNPFGRDLYYYTYFCASQDRVHCAALDDGKGSVVFNGVDPSEENDEQWPLNPRSYKLCHIRQGYENGKETGELIGKCKKLKVKLIKKKKKKIFGGYGFVRAEKSEYDYEEEIEISFNSVMKSQNTMIGIYTKNNDTEVWEEMWVYTGCNNVLGDQEDSDDKSNDCIKKKKKGKVTFGPDNTGRADFEWPPPAGEYYIQLHYYNNSPYDLYIPGDETFNVKAINGTRK